jgi:hypothetical protein
VTPQNRRGLYMNAQRALVTQRKSRIGAPPRASASLSRQRHGARARAHHAQVEGTRRPDEAIFRDTTVQAVVDRAISKVNVPVTAVSLNTYVDEQEKGKVSTFDPDDFAQLTLAELRPCGYFWLLNVAATDGGGMGMETTLPSTRPSIGSSTSSLPDALSSMMQREKAVELVLPARTHGIMLPSKIFNALLDLLSSLSLGWHHANVALAADVTRPLERARAGAHVRAVQKDAAGEDDAHRDARPPWPRLQRLWLVGCCDRDACKLRVDAPPLQRERRAPQR